MEEFGPGPQPRTAFAGRFFNRLDHYKRLMLRFWWIPILALATSEGVEVLFLRQEKPAYVSSGRMIVSVKVSVPDGNVYSEDVENFFGTQVALMQSETVRERVNNSLHSTSPQLQPSPVEIEVTVVPKSSIFNLAATGDDAAYTQAYLQATMDEYGNLKRELLANASGATESSMALELKTISNELVLSKAAIVDFQATNKEVFLQPSGGNSAADYFSYLTRQLDEARSDLEKRKELTLDQNLELDKALLNKQAAGSNAIPKTETVPQVPGPGKNSNLARANENAPGNGLSTTLGDYESAYLTAKQEIIDLESKRAGLFVANPNLGSNAPEVLNVDSQLAIQRNRLATYKQLSEEQLENRKHILESDIRSWEKQVKEWEEKALDTSKKLTAYEALKASAARIQASYDQMHGNLQRLAVDRGIGQESVTQLEPATTPVAILPQLQKHLIMAGLIGVFLGIGMVVFIDRLDDRPRTLTDLEQLFDMPVLGQLPLMKAKNRRANVPILQIEDDRYPMIEAYQSLRSALFYTNLIKDRQPKSIMITSARPDDGKSMVSSNFAVTLAQTGARVLLIDADLRKGVLHRHFSTAGDPGLAEVLSGKCGWTEAIYRTRITNLDVVPCGKPPRNPSALFATAERHLASIPPQYDYYLFDTVPVMVGDDVLSFAPHVDGVIMVVRAGFTSGRMVRAALESLNVRGVNVFGLAFNAVNPKTSGYYNYKFKEYYRNSPAP